MPLYMLLLFTFTLPKEFSQSRRFVVDCNKYDYDQDLIIFLFLVFSC